MFKVTGAGDDDDAAGQIQQISSYPCCWKNCERQVEGKIPAIDFLVETFYACQFIYSCTFAVHFECYGGDKIMTMNKAADDKIEEEKKEAEVSEEEEDDYMHSYIAELGQPSAKQKGLIFS